jgi:hypothetical protein
MHNLHGPDRLFETRHGHVLRCECCGRIQIAFREHTLLVDADDLEVLTDTIKHAWEQVRSVESQDQWTLQAGTDAGPVAITLTEPSLRLSCGLKPASVRSSPNDISPNLAPDPIELPPPSRRISTGFLRAHLKIIS